MIYMVTLGRSSLFIISSLDWAGEHDEEAIVRILYPMFSNSIL